MSHWTSWAIAVASLMTAESALAQIVLPLQSRGSFHRIDPTDTALGARIVALADHGLVPGQFIRLETVGDYDNGPGADTFTGLMTVFSSSSMLLASTNVNRVPGAIDAGRDHVTIPTCPGNLPTDIPQDFTVNPVPVDVLIPVGATHLFIGTRDCFYTDNSDPDADFAIRITPMAVSASPATDLILSVGAPHPNPARDRVTITYSLQDAEHLRVTIHRADGRVVRELLDTSLPANARALEWDGRDANGSHVASGIYFARFATRRGVIERRFVILR